MIEFDNGRRRLVIVAGAGLVFAGANPQIVRAAVKRDEDKEKEVGAVEDLMREHGVIRRAILVYRDMASKLRAKPASVDPDLLRSTAMMFRNFGEDYHEKKLEETHIFPTIKKVGGAASAYVDVLIAQHQRGRELTDYILAVVGKGAIATGDAETLARVLDSVELMYEHHAAHEGGGHRRLAAEFRAQFSLPFRTARSPVPQPGEAPLWPERLHHKLAETRSQPPPRFYRE